MRWGGFDLIKCHNMKIIIAKVKPVPSFGEKLVY